MCCPSKPLVRDFVSLLDSFNLTQCVSGSTHEKGHTLDLVMSHGPSIHVSEICESACISDHHPVLFSATAQCSVAAVKAPSRCHRIINTHVPSQFSAAFNNSELSTVDWIDSLCAEDLTVLFNSTCTSILDSIAPLKSLRPKAHAEPWITDSVRALRRPLASHLLPPFAMTFCVSLLIRFPPCSLSFHLHLSIPVFLSRANLPISLS